MTTTTTTMMMMIIIIIIIIIENQCFWDLLCLHDQSHQWPDWNQPCIELIRHKNSMTYQILTQVWYGWSPQTIRGFTLMLQYIYQDPAQNQQHFLATTILWMECSTWLCLNLHSLLIYIPHKGTLHPVG